jgi:hypothetical protein
MTRLPGTPHPVEPETPPSQEGGEPNPTHLPVEPEFGPQLEPVPPEDPGASEPKL